MIPQVKVSLFLFILLVLTFHRVVFMGETFLGAQCVPGVTPQGPYGYSGTSIPHSTHGMDAGGSGWQPTAETEKLRLEWSRGIPPLWNPNQMLGTPLLHNLQLSSFFPLRLPVVILGKSVTVWDIYCLFLFFLSGIFTFKFLKLFSVTDTSASIGAVCYMLSGFMVMFIHFPFMDVEMLLPLLLWAAENYVRRGTAASAGILSLVVGSALLCGYPVPVFLALFFTLLYGSFRFFTLPRTERNVKRFSGFVLSFVLGSLISAASSLPSLYLLSIAQNNRPPGIGWHHQPFTDSYGLLLPQILSNQSMHAFWPGWQGVVPILLALLGLGGNAFPFPRVFFGAAAVVCFFKLVGLAPIHWIAGLPIFERVNFTRYLQPQFAFAVAVLATIGAERLHLKMVSKKALWFVSLGITLFSGVLIGLDYKKYGQWTIESSHLKRVVFFLVLQLCFLIIAFSFRKSNTAVRFVQRSSVS